MKIKEISVHCEFKKSLPNYQNVTFSSGATATIEEKDDVTQCYDKLWEMCGEEINKQLEEFGNKKV